MIVLSLGIGMVLRLIYQGYIQEEIDLKNQEITEELKKIDYTVKGDTVLFEVDSLEFVSEEETEEIIDIEEVEIKPEKVERSNELFQKPFHIISISAYGKKQPAIDEASKIKNQGLSGNFMWIPDYQQGGKELYKVYIGPFKTRKEAETAKDLVKSHFKGCYVQSFK